MLGAAALIAFAPGIYAPVVSDAAITERVVTDPNSGLAISGFDPVAYFTESAAKLGNADLEFRYAGAIWRFRNEGNRSAFEEDPEIYMPRFGGYDPVGLARGVSVPGHPLYWLVHGERLYLFYNAKARAAFAAEPERLNETAERRWPEIEKSLTR
jgi:hypothetical protein